MEYSLFMNLAETLQNLALSKEDLQPVLAAVSEPLSHPDEPSKPKVLKVGALTFSEDLSPAKDGSAFRQWSVESGVGSQKAEYLGTFSDRDVQEAIEMSLAPDVA